MTWGQLFTGWLVINMLILAAVGLLGSIQLVWENQRRKHRARTTRVRPWSY